MAAYAALLAAASACGEDSAGARSEFYALARADDRPLPLELERDSTCITSLRAAALTLQPGERFHSTYAIERQCAGEDPIRLPDPGAAGTYTRDGERLIFTQQGGGPAGDAVINGDTIVIRGRLHTLEFRRFTPPTAQSTE